MKKIINRFLVISLIPFILGCEKDDYYANNGEETIQSPNNLSKPEFAKDLTTTTTTDVTFRCRFANGGDTGANMKCKVYWRKYTSKPSSSPKTSDMSNCETMRQISSTRTSTTFDRGHTGMNGGDYIYYYFECSNSKYYSRSDLMYGIVKR